MDLIKAANVFYKYIVHGENEEEETTTALNDFSVNIEKGSFVCLLGHNGSGKSTFAKLVNALNLPSEGTVLVSGMNTADEHNLLGIRERAGMVFQNPDNQIIGNIVEEDVAFGPENIGIPTDEIIERVDTALTEVEMTKFRTKSPNRLSGGQKQRVAIAGVLAIKPECIVFDEPTAMLDPEGRKEVLRTAHKLNKEEGITIILITHYMEETVGADRIIVMEKGNVALDSEGKPMDGSPKEILSKVEDMRKLSLTVPVAAELAYELRQEGVELPEGILTREELAEALLPLIR